MFSIRLKNHRKDEACPWAAFSLSFLPRPKQPSELRTHMTSIM